MATPNPSYFAKPVILAKVIKALIGADQAADSF